jgi:hypothetical protein
LQAPVKYAVDDGFLSQRGLRSDKGRYTPTTCDRLLRGGEFTAAYVCEGSF